MYLASRVHRLPYITKAQYKTKPNKKEKSNSK